MNRLLQYIGIFASITAAAFAAYYIYQNSINFLDPFFYWAGIFAVIASITFLILRIFHGKNWVTKSGKAFILGSDLIAAIDNTLKELPKPTRSTISNLGGHILYRFTRLGMLALGLALIPIWLLWQQNKKIDLQNDRINIQNNLLEADRRSSLIVMMSNILDRVDDEIQNKQLEFEELNTHPDSMQFPLSKPLINRIVALSRAFQPYQKLQGDTLSHKLISPERGQLFISLMENQLDSFTQNTIVQKGNFDYAIIGEINLNHANLHGANLHETDLRGAILHDAILRGADLRGANLEVANLEGADLSGADFIKVNFGGADLDGAHLNGTHLDGAHFDYADLSGADLSGAFLGLAELPMADLSGADLSGTDLRRAYLRGTNLSRANFLQTYNHSKEQLLKTKSLYKSIALDPSLKTQLQNERPCLFTEKGCSTE